jgi:hypothetical protein
VPAAQGHLETRIDGVAHGLRIGFAIGVEIDMGVIAGDPFDSLEGHGDCSFSRIA